MPSQSKTPFRTPFGKNEFKRSTKGMLFESYTVAASTIPLETIDGAAGQKVLQPGTVMAKIISGPDSGKIGPFQTAGTDEVQTLTGGGTISGGTWDLTILGVTITGIAHDVTAGALQTAVRAAIAASSISDAEKAIGDSITITGGPLAGSGVFTITYNGELGANVAQVTVATGSLTGAGASITPATSTPGVAGATDGRGDTANIVGLAETFLPWQLMERDVEIAVMYEGAVIQANCFVLNGAGQRVALDNTTAAAMSNQKTLDIRFK